MEREILEKRYKELGNSLREDNKHRNFFNHCYWRISNDNACLGKWTYYIGSPFYKMAPIEILRKSVKFLQEMKNDSNKIDEYNFFSLKKRGKLKNKQL